MLQNLKKKFYTIVPRSLQKLFYNIFFKKILLKIVARRKGYIVLFINKQIHVINQSKKIIIKLSHIEYAFDTVEDFDYYFNSVVSTKISKYETVDYSTKMLHQLKVSDRIVRHYIFNSLPEGYASTIQYLKVLDVKDGEFVLDLGAYCGSTTIEFCKINPTGIVVAIEPDYLNYSTLRENLLLHQINNVIPINAAIDYTKRTLKFNHEGNLGSSSYTIRDYNSTFVSTVTLSEIESITGKKIDAIKMDIEGAELSLIKNSELYFMQNKPRLVIEPHLDNTTGELNTEELLKYLKKYGYTHFEILNQELETYPLIFATCK